MDFLIVGQGLAGSLLARHLLAEGKRVLVVDRDELNTSSKIAAGLVTPIYGGKFKTADDLADTLPYAKKFYWELEEELGSIFFHHQRIARLFQNEEESTLWKKRLSENPEELAEFHDPLNFDHDLIHAPHGGFEMRGGGWLDLPLFLEAMRLFLLGHAAYAISHLKADEVVVGDHEVRWKNITAEKVIFCQGWRGNQNRFFDWVPMNPAKGEIVDFESVPLDQEPRILNSGGWILPHGEGKFRAGSTYDHHAPDADPTDAGKEIISQKIQRIIRPDFHLTAHRAAFRPTIRQSQVCMGIHPGLPRVGFFNGLGSKGVLNGPWFARQLAGHLLGKNEIDEKVDLRRNFP